MLLAWPWLLALGLLVGRGEAQSCTQAYGGPNLARGQPTMQASPVASSGPGSSGCAVNGVCNGNWNSASCTQTNLVNDPWWSVDLGKEYSISLVVVKNRQDCCGYRLQGATVYVGNYMGDFGSSSISCGTITNIEEGSLTTIPCNGAVGRYVTIAITDRVGYLTVCGVEVYGTCPLSRRC
ncbi:fucolectin-1-like [Heteronotia binoei]|uniref:fucolectin-1-like n=1 Tax=Heteronotia binoei TaxID=13085 RepID=UPI00292EC06F|nr:fucolectin-1-like [Heteronotia binoei]